MDSDRIAGDRTDVWSGFEMDGWENDLLVDQIEGNNRINMDETL